MNDKGTKHKTRGKSSKTAHETQDDSEIIDNIEVESQSLNTNDTSVQEMSDCVTIVDNNPVTNDVPKKPKRSKDKKKKQLLIDDSKTKEENNETRNDVQELCENSEKCMENTVQIAPCVRKKKKRAKKQQENVSETMECSDLTEVKFTSKDSMKLEISKSVPANTQTITENKDDSTSKKKKKKKRRHDLEPSEKCDPYTLAFQKLTESPNETQFVKGIIDPNEKNEIQKVLLINPTMINSEEIKIQQSEIRKETTKEKNNVPEVPITVQDVEISVLDIENISKDNSLIIEENTSETYTKPKAEIVKPFQKKLKNESDSGNLKSDHNLAIKDEEAAETEELVRKKYTIKKGSSSENNDEKKDVLIPKIFKTDCDINETSLSETNKHGNRQNDDLREPLDIVNTQQSELISKNSNTLNFVEVKPSKSKKKRNKNITPSNISEHIEKKLLETTKEANIQNVVDHYTENKIEIKSEEIETHKVIIPDLIEYPRSTSQQYVDSNNNTFIQEIIATDEVELAIPINMPKPIIQGSGESPETKSNSNVIDINVTEIFTQHSSNHDEILLQSEKAESSEKTDIKSKMIEVNRDMEVLRRSIERSLAELTATDKSDSEVDKQFNELFQSQTTDPISTEITEAKNNVSERTAEVCEKSYDVQLEKKDNEISEKNIDTFELSPNKVDKIKHEHRDLEVTHSFSDKDMGLPIASDDYEIKKCAFEIQGAPPVCPARREKGKTKSKKKGKHVAVTINTNTSLIAASQYETSSGKSDNGAEQKTEKSQQNSGTTEKNGKQQNLESEVSQNSDLFFEPIENFEDALTSSIDDVNQTFEVIAKEATQQINLTNSQNNPQINIIAPTEDSEGEENNKKQSAISRPKNLLGHTNIPASSNKNDFKKEKNRSPNEIQAKVKIKDSVEVEKSSNKISNADNNSEIIKESNGANATYLIKTNDDLIFKYSFRKVFLQSVCHVCNKELVNRIPCKFCSLVFYCSQKHKDENWSQHQSLCFAVSTVAHLKEQKHIYADAKNISGHEFRVLRMQAILSCEKILDRKLMPWEQEALLYPRICADVKCRQWKQEQLKDCAGCGQISYCINHPEHLSLSHQRWCKSYALYQKLVNYQLTKGRIEPPLPTKVLNSYRMAGKINDVLGSMYEEKIDMKDIQYAALTQMATAPLTTAYSFQIHSNKMNSTCANGARKNSTFTIHTVGAELPFDADTLNKWEIFFLHLRSDVQDLRVVMVGPNINSSELPLDLLGNIKLCENCQTNKRRVIFDFYDNKSYYDYYVSDGFVTPDIVCAYNPNIHRSSGYDNEKWPSTINCILKQRVPFVITSYSIEELRRDIETLRECAKVDFNVVSEIKYNPFGSVRPDRNFITDHEIPLLFKNYCFCILCGTL